MSGSGYRIVAAVIGALWAGFWVFFGVASGIGERLSSAGVLVHAAVPGLVFVATVVAALRWPVAGSVVLSCEGLAIIAGYPLMVRGTPHLNPTTVGFIWLTMGLPPLLAALLFSLARRA